MAAKKRSLVLIPFGLVLALVFGLVAGWLTGKIDSRNSTDYSASQSAPTNPATTLTQTGQLTVTPSIPNATLPALSGATPNAAAITGALVGKPAPDFSLKTLDGQGIRLSDLKGHPVLINFWASWCIPCRSEMPAIQSAFDQYKNQGLVVLGVNFTSQDDLTSIQSFVAALKINFPILLDETGSVVEKFHVIGLPTSYFIGRDGSINQVNIGPMTPAEIANNIKLILN